MELLDSFISFFTSIFNFEIFDIPLLAYLITITLFTIIFEMIKSLGGNK